MQLLPFPEVWSALIAAGLCLLITPVMRRMAIQLGAFDEPGGRRVHVERAPRLGGLAVLAAFAGALVMGLASISSLHETLLHQSLERVWLFLGVGVIAAVGIADDLWNLSPGTKLAAESAAALLAFLGGFHIMTLENPFTGEHVFLGPLAAPVTLLWILSVTNAFNVIDGLDGLATGVALIATLTIWFIASIEGREDLTFVAVILAGALCGFLFHNFHPASIFLGDSGSLFLGYILAILTVEASRTGATEVRFLIPLALCSFPLADLALAAMRRFFTPVRRPFQMRELPRLCLLGVRAVLESDRAHLHHRLLAHGFSQRQAVLLLYMASALCSIVAVLLVFFP